MSAIFGIFYRDGQMCRRGTLEKMSEILVHRGEGSGIWIKNTVGLGDRKLYAAQELLQKKKPLSNTDNTKVIIADCRIDNRDELLRHFNISKTLDSQISDTCLILKAYERWGEDCTQKLLGDFVFAIWNDSEQRLFCARDHIGIKSFYYYLTDQLFVFATEIKALFCHELVPKSLNEIRVGDYLTQNMGDKTATFYKNIIRLSSAHSLMVEKDGEKLREYWQLNPDKKMKYKNDDEYAENFRDIFQEAVHCRLSNNLSIGSTLSGGLDSSSVACTADKLLSEKGNKKLPTFSYTFKSLPQCDESHFMKIVIDNGNFQPHFFEADKISSLTDIDKIIEHIDQPLFGYNLFLHWHLYQESQKKRVQIVLDGFDGDTTVSHGMLYLTELAATGHWIKLLKNINSLSRNFNVSSLGIFKQYIYARLMPLSIQKGYHFMKTFKPKVQLSKIIKQDFVDRSPLKDRYVEMVVRPMEKIKTEKESHFDKWQTGSVPLALEEADKIAAAFSVVPRFPFFDKRLVEFCLSLPAEQKLYDGWTRMILRRAMKDILPEKIRWRGGKANISSNFIESLTRDNEQKRFNDMLLNAHPMLDDFIDLKQLHHQYYNIFMKQKKVEEVPFLWKTIVLDTWLKRFFK